ncbi:O-antigen ligase family protein [Vibrio vulnificus]|uniref:O-antigen ligase family protein n=1 Tax=Vibrio vulnificus TaxID=672 RepID=UPI00307FB591
MIFIIKMGVPILSCMFLIFACVKNPKLNFIIPALFFTSVVSFSQNFNFFFREIHQLIQVFICLFCMLTVLKTRKIPKATLPMLCFLFFIFLSLLFNSLDFDARVQTINYFIAMLVAISIFICLRDRNDLIKSFRFVSTLSLILAVFSILEFIILGSPRVEASFANPNYLALFLGVAFSLTFYFQNKFRNTTLTLIFIAIYLTGSRSALIIPFLTIFFVLVNGDSSFKKYMLFSVSVLISILILSSDSNRFATDELRGSDAERILFSKVALKMSEDHIYTGVGWGRFIVEFSNYSRDVMALDVIDGVVDISLQERRVTHNDFLRILAELGYIAFIVCVLFVGYSAWLVTFKFRLSDSYLFSIYFGLIIFSMTHNNLNTAFSWFFLVLPFSIYIGSHQYRVKNC